MLQILANHHPIRDDLRGRGGVRPIYLVTQKLGKPWCELRKGWELFFQRSLFLEGPAFKKAWQVKGLA